MEYSTHMYMFWKILECQKCWWGHSWLTYGASWVIIVSQMGRVQDRKFLLLERESSNRFEFKENTNTLDFAVYWPKGVLERKLSPKAVGFLAHPHHCSRTTFQTAFSHQDNEPIFSQERGLSSLAWTKNKAICVFILKSPVFAVTKIHVTWHGFICADVGTPRRFPIRFAETVSCGSRTRGTSSRAASGGTPCGPCSCRRRPSRRYCRRQCRYFRLRRRPPGIPGPRCPIQNLPARWSTNQTGSARRSPSATKNTRWLFRTWSRKLAFSWVCSTVSFQWERVQ